MNRRKQLQDFLKGHTALNITVLAEIAAVNVQTLHKFLKCENPENLLKNDLTVERIERELARYGYERWVSIEEEGLPEPNIYFWTLVEGREYVRELCYLREKDLSDELVGYGAGWYSRAEHRCSHPVKFYQKKIFCPAVPSFHYANVPFKEGGSVSKDLSKDEIIQMLDVIL